MESKLRKPVNGLHRGASTSEEISDAKERLVHAFASIPDEKDIEHFLRELLTPNELRTIVLRWRLLELLHEGETQRAIAKRLRISLCKITQGSRILKSSDSVSRRFLGDATGTGSNER